MKTTYSYFPGMFENPNYLRKKQNQKYYEIFSRTLVNSFKFVNSPIKISIWKLDTMKRYQDEESPSILFQNITFWSISEV